MITYFATNVQNGICDNLMQLWKKDCKKKEKKSIKIIHRKRKWYLSNTSSGFRNALQSLRKEKKSQESRNSENNRKGRSQHNQQRNKKNNNSRPLSRSNNQHNPYKSSTNKLIKNDKKEWPTSVKALKEKRKRKHPIFQKIRPYKQRLEERFETVDIQNYYESETNNNDQQNGHIIIVPNTQEVPNQVEENLNNSVRDNFFFMANVLQNPTQGRYNYSS